MDTNRVKKATEWFYRTVFQDEAIRPGSRESIEPTPSPLRAARSLEKNIGSYRQSRESLFVKQGMLLSNYEDDFVYQKSVLRYFPTYQSLTDPELRGYFSWRTKLRRGDIQKTSLTFAFLYIYELLNQIGTVDPMDGYQKLKAFQAVYGELDAGILPYISRWLTDYVIYYGLDPALLADTAQVRFDKHLAVLINLESHDTRQIMEAVTALSGRWLERSKFYKTYREDMDTVIARVLRRTAEHYAGRCKKTMVEQYFGVCKEFPVMLFDSAVFYNREKTRSCVFAIDEICTYRCKNGLWSVRKYVCPEFYSSKLGDLIKSIDSVMREYYGYGHPIQRRVDTKWLLKLMEEETLKLLAEKKAAQEKKVTIRYSQLSQIRRDAAITQDKLIVEEEAMAEESPEIPVSQSPAMESGPEETPLSREEYRLMQCLLYGRDLGWVQSSGLMLSVLADSINEKLFETFADSVLALDGQPELIEDYIEDLKEMVHP